MARITRLHPPDCHAQQDQNHREHHVSLRGMPGSIQILLYLELVCIHDLFSCFFLVGCTGSTLMTSTAGLKSSVASSKQDSMLTSYTTTTSVSEKERSSQNYPCELNKQNFLIANNHNYTLMRCNLIIILILIFIYISKSNN